MDAQDEKEDIVTFIIFYVIIIKHCKVRSGHGKL